MDASNAARIVLNDAKGVGDWIDTAATTGNETVDLHTGNSSTLGGAKFLTIGSTTTVNNLTLGAGTDTAIANNVGDKIVGGGGLDTFLGGSGNDTFVAGLGGQAEIGGQEGAPEFGHQFLAGVTFVAPCLAPEIPVEPRGVAGPVRHLMGKAGVMAFRVPETLDIASIRDIVQQSKHHFSGFLICIVGRQQFSSGLWISSHTLDKQARRAVLTNKN